MLIELQSRITNLLHTYYTILGLQTTDLSPQLLTELTEIFNLISQLEKLGEKKIEPKGIINIVESNYIHSDISTDEPYDNA